MWLPASVWWLQLNTPRLWLHLHCTLSMASSTNSKYHANTAHLEIRKCSFSYYVAGATSGMVVLVLDKEDAPKHNAQREDDEHGEHSALVFTSVCV